MTILLMGPDVFVRKLAHGENDFNIIYATEYCAHALAPAIVYYITTRR